MWSLFDEQTEDGFLAGYSLETLDEVIGFPGLAAAMLSVEWLFLEDETLTLPRFEDHNGQSAKRRATETQRKNNARNVSAEDADKKRPRERERERSKSSPIVPLEPAAQPERKPRKGTKQTLATWLASLAEGERAIPPDDSVFEYSSKAGLTQYIALAWHEFREYHLARPDKKQLDWRSTFRNYVRQNYLKLWQPKSDGGYELTGKGVQADRARRGNSNADA